MPETLEKLRPDRDLQCYFEKPSAIASLSSASADGFTLSGAWRQQFDWAVIEWNRDNVYEHPLFRNLPDGDLSGLTLSYDESRQNCIPIDSDLYPTVDWPYLRIWADDDGTERLYKVRLRDYAVPVSGEYVPASAVFELSGTVSAGGYVGIAWPGEHHTYQMYATDTIESVATAIANSVNAFSTLITAEAQGGQITLRYAGGEPSLTGHNGNRFGAYAYATGGVYWAEPWRRFTGGVSPSTWKVVLNFGNLIDIEGRTVPARAIRKMRWTYSAEMQQAEYTPSEFDVQVSNWIVSGSQRGYCVAGGGSRRIEDDNATLEYSGVWTRDAGNFSGGTISHTSEFGAAIRCAYSATREHTLLLGTRIAAVGATVEVKVDSGVTTLVKLQFAGEDTLVRVPLGELGPGDHSVTVIHRGEPASTFYFDFLEVAVKTESFGMLKVDNVLAVATDWDTDHSLALPAERTAWMIQCLGLRGRVNHYVGAMWFYELIRKDHQYASLELEFVGTPAPNEVTQIVVGRIDRPAVEDSTLTHLNHAGDTAEMIAKAFEIEINNGYTGIRAESSAGRLKIVSRSMGADGNKITVAGSSVAGGFMVVAGAPTLVGGEDGTWVTNLEATPRINRAARDWSRAFYRALNGYGMDVVAAFSMELQHGDPSLEAGMAQRYPNGNAVVLNTPALQTNFSPASVVYWKEVYAGMAALMRSAGVEPYLQFGEVQWWYFPSDGSGMPFYDEYTRQRFRDRFGRELSVIPSNLVNPSEYAEEVQMLPVLIGEFTRAVMDYVKLAEPGCRFEVLYPTDVNESDLNRLVNFPQSEWTPATLESLKTESFGFTMARDLNKCKSSLQYGKELGFARGRKSHLIGVSAVNNAWKKEARLAKTAGLESVVLFALDQLCLVGHRISLRGTRSRSLVSE